MEILLWLVPAALVTVAAMLWVSWIGRSSRGEVDREVAVARLAEAMTRESPGRERVAPRSVAPPPRERSTGVAVRPSRRVPAAGPSGARTRPGR